MSDLVLPKGTRFMKPEAGQTIGRDGLFEWTGYELAEDVYVDDVILPQQFIPRGDVPIPSADAEMPKWLCREISRVRNLSSSWRPDPPVWGFDIQDRVRGSFWERLVAVFIP